MICEVGLKINNARSIHISNDTNVVTGACGQDFSYNPLPPIVFFLRSDDHLFCLSNFKVFLFQYIK